MVLKVRKTKLSKPAKRKSSKRRNPEEYSGLSEKKAYEIYDALLASRDWKHQYDDFDSHYFYNDGVIIAITLLPDNHGGIIGWTNLADAKKSIGDLRPDIGYPLNKAGLNSFRKDLDSIKRFEKTFKNIIE